MIVNAGSNENVMITLSDRSSLTKEETDLLQKRPDISLTLIFTMDGITYKVTVPAGADLDKYRNASGGIDVITLCGLFGYTAV